MRKLWPILFLLCASFGFAQNAVLMPIPEQPFLNNGVPLANGFVYTYAIGTFNQAPSFTDYTGLVTNTNPVQLNASGFPTTSIGAQCGIWLQPGALYRIVVQNSAHVQIYQIDGVAGLVPSVSTGTVSAVTATPPIASSGGTVPNISASVSGNGSNVATTNASGSTANRVATWDGNGNLLVSSSLLSALAPLASPAFSGTPTFPSSVIPVGDLTPGTNGQCNITAGGASVWGNCNGSAGGAITGRFTSNQTQGIGSTVVDFIPSGTLAANTEYSFQCEVLWSMSSVTGGVNTTLEILDNGAGSGGNTGRGCDTRVWTDNVGTSTDRITPSGAVCSSSTYTGAAGAGFYEATVRGGWKTGAAAGHTLSIQFNGGSTFTTTIGAGSYCTLLP